MLVCCIICCQNYAQIYYKKLKCIKTEGNTQNLCGAPSSWEKWKEACRRGGELEPWEPRLSAVRSEGPGPPLVAPARSSLWSQADPSPPPGHTPCGNWIQGEVPVALPCVFHHGQCSPVSVAHGAGRAPGVQGRGRTLLEDVQLSSPYPQLWGPPLQDRECSVRTTVERKFVKVWQQRHTGTKALHFL